MNKKRLKTRIQDLYKDAKEVKSTMLAGALSYYYSKSVFFAASSTEVGQGAVKVTDNLLKEFSSIYTSSVFFIVLFASVAALFISHNDKVVGAAKKIAIGSCIVYIIAKWLENGGSDNKIGRTMDSITQWAG